MSNWVRIWQMREKINDRLTLGAELKRDTEVAAWPKLSLSVGRLYEDEDRIVGYLPIEFTRGNGQPRTLQHPGLPEVVSKFVQAAMEQAQLYVDANFPPEAASSHRARYGVGGEGGSSDGDGNARGNGGHRSPMRTGKTQRDRERKRGGKREFSE